MDQTTDVTIIKSIGKAPAFAQQWASTDFKIAYDPCTCYYPSFLRVDVNQISASTIELHGRSVTLEDEPLVNNVNLQVNPAEYLSGFDYTGNTTNGGGVAMHKSILYMLEDYTAKYESYNKKLVEVGEHNKQVKINLAILKMGKFVAGLLLNPLGGIIPDNPLRAEMAAEMAASETLGLSPEAIAVAYEGLGVDNTDWFKVVKNLKDGVVKANEAGQKVIDNKLLFKYIKQIFGEKGKTFIVNNFEEKSMPSAPAIPTATFSEMHYTGLISDYLLIGGTRFYSPGTYGSEGTGTPPITSAYEYPVYNQVLGTFALLKSPKIKISESIPIDTENELDYTSNFSGAYYHTVKMQRYQSWTKEYQIQLAEDLQFAINDVLDVKDYTVQASFNILAIPKLQVNPANATVNIYHDPETNVNVQSNNTAVNDDYTKLRARSYPYHYYAENPEFSEEVYVIGPDGYIPPAYTVMRDTVAIQTPFLPLDAFQPFVAGMGLRNESIMYNKELIDVGYAPETYPTFFNPETGTTEFVIENPLIEKPIQLNPNTAGYKYDFYVELKLIVDINFNTVNSDGEENSISQVLTYVIDPENITWLTSDIVPGLIETDKNIGQYKEELYFEDLDFHGQDVNGCTLEGTNYTCVARDLITIDGDISSSAGYSVDMIAGNLIKVVHESQVSPEIVLQIDEILDFSHPMPKANQEYVRNFCKGVGGAAPPYMANVSSLGLNDETAEITSEEITNATRDKSNFSYKLYPNPTLSEVYI